MWYGRYIRRTLEDEVLHSIFSLNITLILFFAVFFFYLIRKLLAVKMKRNRIRVLIEVIIIICEESMPSVH